MKASNDNNDILWLCVGAIVKNNYESILRVTRLKAALWNC